MKQLLLGLSSGNPTLSNFVTGSNTEMLQMLRDLLGGRVRERMVYLWGESGSGKSHLLAACCNEASDAGLKSAYISCEANAEFDVEADFVAVDDVQKLGEAGQIGLFHLYNSLREKGGGLLASGNAPPLRIGLRPDLATRLGWGLVYQVHALVDDEKREALQSHARARGFDLSAEVVNYLMHHVRRDLPTLVAMLDALDDYSLENRRPITIPLLKEIMERMKCA